MLNCPFLIGLSTFLYASNSWTLLSPFGKPFRRGSLASLRATIIMTSSATIGFIRPSGLISIRLFCWTPLFIIGNQIPNPELQSNLTAFLFSLEPKPDTIVGFIRTISYQNQPYTVTPQQPTTRRNQMLIIISLLVLAFEEATAKPITTTSLQISNKSQHQRHHHHQPYHRKNKEAELNHIRRIWKTISAWTWSSTF